MSDLLQDLKDMQEQVEAAKNEKSKLEGKIEQLKDRLKSDYGVSTLDEAKELILDMNEKLSKDEATLNNLVNEIKVAGNFV